MKLLDRIRRLWKTSEGITRSASRSEMSAGLRPGFDARALLEQDYVGRDFDPDEPRSGRL